MFKCPKCGAEMYMQVPVIVEIPTSLYSHLSKKNLRSRKVVIMGANWTRAADMYCKECGHFGV